MTHEERVTRIATRDALNLRTPQGRLLADILAGVETYEEARAPMPVGRPKGVPAKATAEVVALVRAERAKGTPVMEIVKITGLSRRHVYNILEG